MTSVGVPLFALSLLASPAAARLDATTCAFSRGTTTCVATAQYTETTTHDEISGCLFGPSSVPGRRARTFRDTFLVTESTTTLQHGRHGKVYDISTASSRELVSSVQIADVCTPL